MKAATSSHLVSEGAGSHARCVHDPGLVGWRELGLYAEVELPSPGPSPSVPGEHSHHGSTPGRV